MILNISIKNYKSLKEETNFTLVAEASKSKEPNVFLQKLASGKDEVRLLNTALIYGANASGKTNLLKCLFEIINFIKDSRLKVGEEINIYEPFLFAKSMPDTPVIFSIEFAGKDEIKYKYDLSFNQSDIIDESLTYYPCGQPKLLFERIVDNSPKSRIHSAKLGVDIKKREIEVFTNQTVLSKFGDEIPDKIISEVFVYLINIEVINACNTRKVSSLKNEISGAFLRDERFKQRMDELIVFADTGINSLKIKEVDEDEINFPENTPIKLKSLLYDNLKFQIAGIHDVYDKDKISGQKNLSFDQESHGTKTIFSLGGKLLQILESGSIIFIDEIETGLHPYLVKLLVRLFQNKRINSKNAQLIFTTHDTNLLDRTLFRKDQVWFTEKNEQGITDLYSLQDFSDVREDTPFDKWYMAGKFGGIPNLKSLESLFVENEAK